jgi:hypothetical protein
MIHLFTDRQHVYNFALKDGYVEYFHYSHIIRYHHTETY